MTLKRTRIGLRIPVGLNTKLILISQAKGISKNALILEALWQYVEKKQQEGKTP